MVVAVNGMWVITNMLVMVMRNSNRDGRNTPMPQEGTAGYPISDMKSAVIFSS